MSKRPIQGTDQPAIRSIARRLSRTGQKARDALWSEILRERCSAVRIEEVPADPLKTGGLTEAYLVHFRNREGKARHVYLKGISAGRFGEDKGTDAAADALWRLTNYSVWPGHSNASVAAIICSDGRIVSIAAPVAGAVSVELPLAGKRYADFLRNASYLRTREALRDARAVCRAIAAGHRPAGANAKVAYRRALRLSLVDSFLRTTESASFWRMRKKELAGLERLVLDWRAKLAPLFRRAVSLHADPHPWNVLLDGTRVSFLGRRFPCIGEPAADLAALSINFLLLAEAQPEQADRYHELFRAFWRCYEQTTGDRQAARLSPPFFAIRAAVFLNDYFYASLPGRARMAMFRLLEEALGGSWEPRLV